MGDLNKLLAPIEGTPMVARVVDAALTARADPVVVVTGHDADRVAAAVSERDVIVAHNPNAARGLSTSLRAGLAMLAADVDATLVCLGDMPWVGAEHLDALIRAFAARRDRPICVPVHDGGRGNPVLWPARHFSELGALVGDVGGRQLLRRYREEIESVRMSDEAITRDVDTPADLSRA
jgi:molybdenum cofactor cytidylyltransferase